MSISILRLKETGSTSQYEKVFILESPKHSSLPLNIDQNKFSTSFNKPRSPGSEHMITEDFVSSYNCDLVSKKITRTGPDFHLPCDPLSQSNSQWKWYRIAYSHSWYERLWLNSSQVHVWCQNFDHGRWPTGHPFAQPYVTYVDQKQRKKQTISKQPTKRQRQRNKARRANAKMIYICHTYRTSSQSSPFHNQSSLEFELLHATFQQNDCTSSSIPTTLWPWVNVQVIQTGIKLWNLVISIIPSLEQINSHVSWHMMMLNVYFIKIMSAELSPLNTTHVEQTLARAS